MSHLSVRGEQSSDDEISTLDSLAALAISGAGQAIAKTSATTFANVTFGTGSVTSIATAGLISGGTITTTGTITTSMATNKLVGRSTAGTGIMEEITLGTGLSFTGTTLNAATTSPGGSQYNIQVNDGSGGFYGDATASWDYSSYTMTLGAENQTAFIKGADATPFSLGNGANLALSPGLNDTASPGGVVGKVSIYDPANGFNAFLIPDPTGDWDYQFPRASGTIALTSDFTGYINGSVGAITNAIPRANGTGGSTVQASTVYIDSLGSITTAATQGSEMVPALTAGNWTVGAGWESPIVGPGLIKNANGTGTQTPSGTFTVVAGRTYLVTAQLSSFTSGSVNLYVGGAPVMTLGSTTLTTAYVTARTTAKLILLPTNSSRFTVGSISVKELTTGWADLTMDGDLTVRSDINLVGKINIQGGLAVGHSQSTGNNANWFFGGAGGSLNHTAGSNIGIGSGVLQNATAGASNVGVGFNVLSNGSMTGNDNLGFGAFALWFSTAAANQTAFGSSAGVLGTTASRNTMFGREALQANSTTAEGVAIGYQAGFSFGAAALALGTGGNGLTLIGAYSGYDLTSGVNNTFVGYNTGRGVTTGTGNTVLGAQVTGLGVGDTNNIILAIGTGVIKARYNTAGNWVFTGGSILPSANDAVVLGAAGTAFSDLFLAEGGVISWDSGDVLITQTGDTLAFTGGTNYTFDDRITVSGETVFDGTTTSTGAGAVGITGSIHEITTTGIGDALTLANGVEGQRLTIVYIAEGAGTDTAVLTPTSFGSGTTITFSVVGQSARLLFTNAKWYADGAPFGAVIA